MEYLYQLPDHVQGVVAYIDQETLSSWFEVGDTSGLSLAEVSLLYHAHAAEFLADWLMRHGGISGELENGLCVRAYRPFPEPQVHGDRLVIAWSRWGNSRRSVYLVGLAPCEFGLALSIEVAIPGSSNAFDQLRLRVAASHLHDVFQWRSMPLHVVGEGGQIMVRRRMRGDQVA